MSQRPPETHLGLGFCPGRAQDWEGRGVSGAHERGAGVLGIPLCCSPSVPSHPSPPGYSCPAAWQAPEWPWLWLPAPPATKLLAKKAGARLVKVVCRSLVPGSPFPPAPRTPTCRTDGRRPGEMNRERFGERFPQRKIIS